MKKILVVLLALVLVFSFVSCGGGEAEPAGEAAVEPSGEVEGTDEGGEAFEGTLIQKLFVEELNAAENPVYMKYIVTYDGMDIEAFWASDGEKSYSEQTSDGQTSGVLTDGTTCYTIMHNERMYLTSELLSDDFSTGFSEETIEEITGEEVQITVGTEDFNGTTYICESIMDGEYPSRFLFDQSTEEWKYMLSDDMVMEILEISNDVDSSWFSLPEGYTELSY